MLTYLQGTSRPDMSMATHQSARCCITAWLSHHRAVYCIGRYPKAIKDKEMNKGLNCYVDADFVGGWDKVGSGNPKLFCSELAMS